MSPEAEGRPISATPDRETAATLATVRRFLDAFGRHDVAGIMDAMGEDCVFENTFPPPDGERHVGQAAVRRFWERFFEETPSAAFETEEMFAGGDRCAVRWLYRWRTPDGSPGHVRGVDLLRVRHGKVVEKLSYVKG
jgi:ketosteroid isomerase-like protein